MKRILLVPATALVFVGLGIALPTATKNTVDVARAVPAPQLAAPKPPAISVVKAEERELVDLSTVTGSLVPREEVVVGVDIEGLKILSFEVDQGDRVKAGQIIARLNDDTLKTQIAQSDSQLAWADSSIAQAKSQIAQAEAAQVEARAALDRAQPLREKGVIGQDVYDQRLSASRSADARLASARFGLELAQNDKKMKEASRRELELKLQKTVIRAPTDGVVLVRNAKVGAIASGAGDPLFRIARDAKIELDAEVPEATLNRIREGMKALVEPPGFDAPVEGEVRLVAPQIDQTTRLGHVRIALAVDPRLKVGSFARGRIELARSKGATVPLSAVNTQKGVSTVQVVKDGRIETRKVEIGVTGDDRVELRKGVELGEAVVLKAGTFVRNGDQVNPIEAKREEIGG